MARISRLVASGYPHHVTPRGVRSMPIFDDDGDRIAYLGFMAEEMKRFSVEVLAWCLINSYPPHRGAEHARVLAGAIGEAHRRYTRMKNFSAGVRGYLFKDKKLAIRYRNTDTAIHTRQIKYGENGWPAAKFLSLHFRCCR